VNRGPPLDAQTSPYKARNLQHTPARVGEWLADGSQVVFDTLWALVEMLHLEGLLRRPPTDVLQSAALRESEVCLKGTGKAFYDNMRLGCYGEVQ